MRMTFILNLFLVSSVLLVLYAYLIYPLLLFLFSKIKPPKKSIKDGISVDLPTVSILIAAHNEEDTIEEKIKNSLQLNYPSERVEIIIGSDGSQDKTDEICKQYCEHIRFERIEPRQGKANVLNTITPMAKHEVILFSDANTILDPDCLKNIVSHFQDDEVGGVCGRLELLSSKEAIVSFERLYWKYESAIKRVESELHSTIGSNGGIYAIRRELYNKIPKNTIVDDFWISLDILEQQKKITFEIDAVGYENLSETLTEEFSRKVRIGAGNMQVFLKRPVIRNQKTKVTNFCFYSHKVIRWMVPLLLIVIYATMGLLHNQGIFKYIFILINLSVVLSLIGILYEIKNKVFETMGYFFLFNAALLIGYAKYFLGKQSVKWKRAKR